MHNISLADQIQKSHPLSETLSSADYSPHNIILSISIEFPIVVRAARE